jgi:hypothetical protein
VNAALLLVAGAALLAAADERPPFVESRIQLENPVLAYQRVDLNGDGREDLILFERDENGERALHVHLQEPDGRFPPKPSTRIAVKRDVIAYSVGDVREDPGLEILFFTRNAVFSYSITKEGYRDNVQKLFEADPILDVPSEDLPFLDVTGDLDGRGFSEIVLPVEGGLEIFAPDTASKPLRYQLADRIRLDAAEPCGPLESGRGTIRFSLGVNAPYSGFLIDDAASEPVFPARGLLEFETFVSAPRLVDVDGDGAKDVVVKSGASLSTWKRSEKGTLPLSRHRAEPIPEALRAGARGGGSLAGGLALEDLNGDGLPDLIARRKPEGGISSREILFDLFVNREGQLIREGPDYRLKLRGFHARVEVANLDADGRPDLLVNVWDAPIRADTALSGVEVVRETHVFLGNEERLFERSAALKSVARYRPEQLDRFDQSGLAAGDFDGDGLSDLVGVDLDGDVTVHRLVRTRSLLGAPRLAREERALYRFTPHRKIHHIEVVDLNRDSTADLLVRLKQEVILLVSVGASR